MCRSRHDSAFIVIALFDVLGGVLLLVALLPAGELVRRAWARVRGDGAPPSDRILRHRPPLRHRRRVLAGLETGQIVFLLMVGPVVGTGAFAPHNAQAAGDSGWQSEEWVLKSLFIVCACAAVVSVPLALVALVQRSRLGVTGTP